MSGPRIVTLEARNGEELRDMLWTAIHHRGGPIAVRYPRANMYHYVDRGDALPRERSERQDVTFTFHGDSVTVDLPPPAACRLYIAATPRQMMLLLNAMTLAGSKDGEGEC